MLRTPALWSSLFAATASIAAAQVPSGHAVVATRLAGTPATQLLDVDIVAGTFVSIGRFPSDALPPLAVASDIVNDDLIVALDLGGSSRFVRLSLFGAAVIRERVLADVAGTATDITIAGTAADVFATFDGAGGGLVRIPRNGGAPLSVRPMPRASVIFGFRSSSNVVLVAQSGSAVPPLADPRVSQVDVSSGLLVQTNEFTGFRPLELTGLMDVPTAVIRQWITTADGTVAESLFFDVPQALPITPALPPGAAVAMAGEGFIASAPLVLGGAVSPFLRTVALFPGPPFTWQIVAGPFPGDPVDIDASVRGSGTVEFGTACGAARPMRGFGSSQPYLGNSLFQLRLSGGVPNELASLVIGLSDQSWLGLSLPLTLPNGCGLLVAPEIGLAHIADSGGAASQPIPIPNVPVLQGALLFGQWLQAPGGVAFVVSTGVRVRLGN